MAVPGYAATPGALARGQVAAQAFGRRRGLASPMVQIVRLELP